MIAASPSPSPPLSKITSITPHMTNFGSNSLTFHPPALFHSPPRPIRVPLRCAHQPPQQQRSVSRRAFLTHLLSAFFLVSAPSSAEEVADRSLNPPPAPSKRPKWGYTPENGPQAWAQLSEDWSIAATGTCQSPIPLSYRTAATSADTPRPTLATNPAKFSVRLRHLPLAANPSLCVQPYVPPPPPLVGDAPPIDSYTPPIPALVTLPATSTTYALRSLYLHVSAEHVLETNPAPLELHLVFEKVLWKPPSPPVQSPPASAVPNERERAGSADATTSPSVQSSSLSVPPAQAADGSNSASNMPVPETPATTLVVAVLATSAEETAPWLSSMLKHFTATAGEDGKGPGIVTNLDMASVLPRFDQSDIYMYTGSLTTPPCTEGVQWLVLSTRFPVKETHVTTILDMQGGPNARPLQEVNGRRVIRFPAVSSST